MPGPIRHRAWAPRKLGCGNEFRRNRSKDVLVRSCGERVMTAWHARGASVTTFVTGRMPSRWRCR